MKAPLSQIGCGNGLCIVWRTQILHYFSHSCLWSSSWYLFSHFWRNTPPSSWYPPLHRCFSRAGDSLSVKIQTCFGKLPRTYPWLDLSFWWWPQWVSPYILVMTHNYLDVHWTNLWLTPCGVCLQNFWEILVVGQRTWEGSYTNAWPPTSIFLKGYYFRESHSNMLLPHVN